MAETTKKLINAPEAVIEDMLEGLVGPFPDLLHRPGPTGRAMAAVDGPREGKVRIVMGRVQVRGSGGRPGT